MFEIFLIFWKKKETIKNEMSINIWGVQKARIISILLIKFII